MLVAVLLAAGAVAFVAGTRIESGGTSEASEHHESAGEEHAGRERVLGVNIENRWTTAVAVVLTVVAAGLALRAQQAGALAAVALFAAVFAAFDAGEVVRQLDGRAAVAALAALAMATHASAGAAGWWMARREPAV